MNTNNHSKKHKTYYHVSPVAGLTELHPHVPRDVDGECDIPRICVCPSVLLAVDTSGIEARFNENFIHIYAISQEPDISPERAYELGTLDAPDMSEYWYLANVQCEHIGTLEQWYAARGYV